tara:strand:- start:196 stop:522 length:327 start_codon:yes stop_codon:yes gene_type:complete
MFKPKKNEEVFIDPIVLFDREEPERRLYLAVILQALLDASNVSNIVTKDKAKAWFFCSVGVTCDNFEFICDNANLDASAVRGFAYEVINSEQKSNFRYRIYQILSDNN